MLQEALFVFFDRVKTVCVENVHGFEHGDDAEIIRRTDFLAFRRTQVGFRPIRNDIDNPAAVEMRETFLQMRELADHGAYILCEGKTM